MLLGNLCGGVVERELCLLGYVLVRRVSHTVNTLPPWRKGRWRRLRCWRSDDDEDWRLPTRPLKILESRSTTIYARQHYPATVYNIIIITSQLRSGAHIFAPQTYNICFFARIYIYVSIFGGRKDHARSTFDEKNEGRSAHQR